ncbi:MAG TPA: anti-sigma factor [Gemmatimonadaceae bacterium]|jgi:anti-sigma-K factor RskA
MTAHAWLDHAAPYALGALDESERATFEEHLAACDVCAAEVRELRGVAGLIAMAAPAVSPPATLRDRILADARGVRPLSSAATDAGQGVRALEPPGRAVTALPARPRQWNTVLPWLAAAAAVVVAVYLGQQARTERTARATAEQALASARLTLDSTGSALARRDSLIQVLVSPDAQAVTVSGSGPAPSAKYFLDRRAGRVIIAASALPPAAPGRTYQLWGIETGKSPVSLGTFNTDASGRALASVAIPAGLRIGVTAVTDEPSGGSPQPTTTPFLAATWKSE